jgi:hypothetical protein
MNSFKKSTDSNGLTTSSICVRSSANENPAKDFNEWMQHVYHQVKINYERKLKISCTKSDSTSDEETTS